MVDPSEARYMGQMHYFCLLDEKLVPKEPENTLSLSASIRRASERNCLIILYWSQTTASEALKRSAEVLFLLFDSIKSAAETPFSYLLDSLRGVLLGNSLEMRARRRALWE